MAFWNFQDNRYKGDRARVILSITGVLLAGLGLFILFKLTGSEQESAPMPEGVQNSLPGGMPAQPQQPKANDALELARKALWEKHFVKAEEILVKSLNQKGTKDESLRLLVLSLKARKAYQLAIDALDRAIELKPQAADRYFSRGECFDALGEKDKAMADFDKAAELSPSNAVFANKRYLFMIRCGRQKAVTSEIGLKLEVGVTSDKDRWVMASAALALNRGRSDIAAKILDAAAQLMSVRDFQYLLQDPLFETHRADPLMQKFYR
jgi:tetratricopeptide (TPR) repeat protein